MTSSAILFGLPGPLFATWLQCGSDFLGLPGPRFNSESSVVSVFLDLDSFFSAGDVASVLRGRPGPFRSILIEVTPFSISFRGLPGPRRSGLNFSVLPSGLRGLPGPRLSKGKLLLGVPVTLVRVAILPPSALPFLAAALQEGQNHFREPGTVDSGGYRQ